MQDATNCSAEMLLTRLAGANSRQRSAAVALADAWTVTGDVPADVAANYVTATVLFDEARRAWEEYRAATEPAEQQIRGLVADLPPVPHLMAVPS